MHRLLLVLALATGLARADEGLWPLDRLPLDSLKAQHDFVPPEGWKDTLQNASLRLSGGCSGSFVSAQGLVLTNQHCVTRCLALLSGVQRNLLDRGFVAQTAEQEAICPELEIQQLLEISDVSGSIQAAGADLSPSSQSLAREAAATTLQERCESAAPHLRCEVVTHSAGAEHRLYKYRRFQDVRLVFAPESAIARFGGTADSFSFPRYALDAALLRVYEDGKPLTPAHFFKARADGGRAGELSFVTGYPGSTQRDLTVAQLETLRDVVLPQRMSYLSELRGILSQFARQGEAQSNMVARELFSIENTLKAFRGRHAALSDPALISARRDSEAALRKATKALGKPFKDTLGAWDTMATAQDHWRDIYTEYSLLELLRGYQSDLVSMARHLLRAAQERQKPDAQRLPEYRDTALPELTQRLFSAAPIQPELETLTLGWSLGMLRELLGMDNPAVQLSLGDRTPQDTAAELIQATRLQDLKVRRQLWEGGIDAITASDDPLIRFVRLMDPSARAIRQRYQIEVQQPAEKASIQISRAIHAVRGPARYPDADFSWRLSIGRILGWQERETTIEPFTTLAGAVARDSGQPPFALPGSWQAVDTELDLTTPMNFVASNDIIAGNSGSAVLNRQAELIGIVFDGNLHALGSAYAWQDEASRAIAVHPAAIKLALEEIYKAPRLSKELFEHAP